MKKPIQLITLLFLTAITLNACKKDSSSSTATASGTAAVVTASNYGFDGLAGSAFNSTTAGIVKVGNIFTVSAIKDGTTNSISIVLNSVTGVGTFSLNKGNTQGNGAIISKDNTKPTDTSLNYSTDNNSGSSIGGGSVVITSLTATDAQGTFSIVAYNAAGRAAFVEQGTFKGHVN